VGITASSSVAAGLQVSLAHADSLLLLQLNVCSGSGLRLSGRAVHIKGTRTLCVLCWQLSCLLQRVAVCAAPGSVMLVQRRKFAERHSLLSLSAWVACRLASSSLAFWPAGSWERCWRSLA
jgi:hypothetical protein